MDNIFLKRTNSEDTNFTSLVKQLDRDLHSRYGADQEFFDQFNKLDHIKNVVVAFNGDIPVACGAIKVYDTGTMEVKRMFVSEGYRGRKISKKVLAELEKWAAEMGYASCILETGTNQPEAIALYNNSGYTVIDNYGQYAGVETSICMKKVLRRS